MVNVVSRVKNSQPDNEFSPQAFVVLQNISWPTYQALLADMGEHRAARLTYCCGTLEIKMPSKLHELINRLLERIIATLTEELGLDIVPLGSTRFDAEESEQGVEPDSCFYIQHANCVEPDDIAPPQDIPPDLVVEVDITSSSKSRLLVYQMMGVPEVWRYNRQEIKILLLTQGEYVECSSSPTFPMLSAKTLWRFLELGKQSKNHNQIIAELRAWIRKQAG
ncbi:MAG: Uma2 family endonuclease [Cyanobacteria bacterium P01_F01_bin.150]